MRPTRQVSELELLAGKIDLDVVVDVIRLVGLLIAFGLEAGIPNMSVRVPQAREKVLKRSEQVIGDVLEGFGIGIFQEGEDLLVLLLGLVLIRT